jgi:hypothetical protein
MKSNRKGIVLSRERSVAGVADVTPESANRIWRILAH